MTRQDAYIRSYNWHVTIFYNATPRHASEIMRCLWREGAPAESYWDAQRLLRSGNANEGLTFNNPRTHSSVVVIGHVSNVWEWVETIEHEGRHLVQGICNAYRIDPNSEDAAYMEGRIFKQIVKEFAREMASQFLDL